MLMLTTVAAAPLVPAELRSPIANSNTMNELWKRGAPAVILVVPDGIDLQ